ncbi:MAG: nicotinate-nucleotide--dimethylbenzimidazole phosphoribosyltransferase, partial [Gemmatimonadaceae bacterium]
VQRRTVPALLNIIRGHATAAHSSVLVTAHGHVNRVLLQALAGKGASEFWRVKQVNCEAWKLVFHVSDGHDVQLVSASVVGPRITRADAQRAIDAKTKPLGALGKLEECAVRLCVLQQTLKPELSRIRVCVFGADHGVSDEGVSAYPRAVTAEMMKNFSAGGAAINVLGIANDVQIAVLDVGVDADLSALRNVQHAKVRNGSRNFAVEAAMSVEELNGAFAVGASAARRAVAEGVTAIGLGEMGIGNTTSAAALLAALTGSDATSTVGMGTGVNASTLELKRAVVTRALALHGMRSATVSARECLRRVGGLELAAIVGAAIESLNHPIALVADGFISTVSVLCAGYIAHEEFALGARALSDRVFLAHQSSERGHTLAVESLGALFGVQQRPLLDLEMRLGEGSGAALAMPLLRASAAIMRDMATFESAEISAGDQEAQHH